MGIINAAKVHFKLPVSFFMVNNVVEHDQCISENNIIFIAANAVPTFDINICIRELILSKSAKAQIEI